MYRSRVQDRKEIRLLSQLRLSQSGCVRSVTAISKKIKFLAWGQELESIKTKEIGQARGLKQCENTKIPFTSIQERTETDIGNKLLDF